MALRVTAADADDAQPGAAGPVQTARRTATLALSDGRRLTLTGPAAATPPAAQPADDEHFKLLAEHSTDLIVAVDADLVLRYASPAAQALTGHAAAALLGMTLAELLLADDRAAFIARHFTQSARHGGPDLFRVRRADGSCRWVEARVAALPPGNALGSYLVTLHDAERRRRAEEQLAQMNAELAALAATDALTGLPNRRQFDATLTREWYRALRERAPLALLMVDVDHFKSLNDTFGHPVGDALLTHIARLVRDNARRAVDIAARWGGEEFAVLLPGTGTHGALEIAEAIRSTVARADTGSLIDGSWPLSVSVGVAVIQPADGQQPSLLVDRADAALYQAKHRGRNRVVLAGDA